MTGVQTCALPISLSSGRFGLSDIDEKNSQLLEKTHREYKGEISLFIMNASYRGYGIGKKLFKAMIHHMKKENVNSIYLYTDTDCNYKFYDHQGMDCRIEKDYSYEFHNTEYDRSKVK